jgi:glycosyltransferase involved in cell wall biosynthesis
LRLALLTPDWTPNGGIATYVRLVSAALADAGHQVLVLHGDASDGRAPRGVEIARFAAYSHSAFGADAEAAVGATMDQLLAFRPDVVHLHGVNNIPLERRVLGEFAATKTFHVYEFCPSGTKFHHATDQPCTFSTSGACVPRQAYLRCTLSKRPSVWWSQYRRAAQLNTHNQAFSRCLVASTYVKNQAVRTGYEPERVDVVPYFTTLPAAATAPRPRHILFVGRLMREKGVDLLLDALSRLTGEWTCTIVGDGIASGKIRAHARTRGIDDRVTFAGWLTGDALSAALAAATVVAVPSRWPEPFGIVGIEAMAHARPVVAFRVGGIPDWLDDGVTGYAVAPGDVAAFAARLGQLLDHPDEARALGVAGRARVERDFVASAHLARLLPIYKRLHVGY